MAKGKAMSYEEFIALAKENYTKGGDVAVECWEKYQFDEYVEMFGPVTKQKLCGCSGSGRMKKKNSRL